MDRIGRYRIIKAVGRGATGVVYHAIDEKIGRPVAIKTIQFAGQLGEEDQHRLRERLIREARLAGMLSHPGITTIYDVGHEGDLTYIAMEYVDGQTLQQVLSAAASVPIDQMIRILRQAAAGLDYAHQKDIVHLDIKPANIMITADGAVKISDFGVAKLVAPENFSISSAIVGTPRYMSPEQALGQPVNGHSDQYSLAVIAYEMLTGEKLHAGANLGEIVHRIVTEEPEPSRINPSLTREIDDVVRKGLAKRPGGRYRDCQEFVDALEKSCNVWPKETTGPLGGLTKGRTASGKAFPLVHAPTMQNGATVGTVVPPTQPTFPPRDSQAGIATGEHTVERKSRWSPFLLAIMMGGALFALIAWHPQGSAPDNSTDEESKPTLPVRQQTSVSPPREVTNNSPNPTPSSVPNRSNEPHIFSAERRETSREPTLPSIEPRRSKPTPQTITITSTPGNATVILDGLQEISCTTPCSLSAMPGRHTVTISLVGFESERREVAVGPELVSLPPFELRTPSGTLWVSSEPAGATVYVNGRPTGRPTPAVLQLAAGTYTITVELGGNLHSEAFEVRTGATKLVKITLGQSWW